MTVKQQWLVAALTFAVLATIGVILSVGSTPVYRMQFQSCEQARETGAALPLHVGDVGWNPRLDSDEDGAAC